jgi:putative spermidine/putrescine transport system substrate-binding protein
LPIDRTGRGIPALLLVAVIVASACGSTAETASDQASVGPSARTSAAPSSPLSGSPDPLTELAAAAEQEGTLTTIGLSHEWCGYGEAIETFTSRYAITVNELTPGAGFDEQLAAVRDSKAKPDLAPDVIDVDIPFAAKAKAGKLLAPYKVATWETIPKGLKDADGSWYGGYYGVLVFETNTTSGQRPPVDWADLLQPTRTSTIALAGDPRVSTQAIETVYAAALANGGSLDKAQPGLDFFAKVQKAGNLLPTIATVATIDNGSTPVTIRWTYNALAHRDVANGQPEIDVSVPKTWRSARSPRTPVRRS